MIEDNFSYDSYCEIAIISNDVEPNIITGELNIKPERSFKKGDQSVSKHSGSIITRPHNLWALKSPSLKTEEESIEPHINFLATTFQLKLDVLKKYKNDSRFEVTVWIWVQTDNSGIGLDIDEKQLDFLNTIANRIHFSFLTE